MVSILDIFKKKVVAPVKNLPPPETPNETDNDTMIFETTEMGSSGTKIYSGYLFEDYLDAMNGPGRADIFDKMRRSDYNIRMALKAVKNPIRSADWRIDAGDDTPEALADRDLMDHIIFNDMDNPWDKFLAEAMTLVDFGFSLFEVTHKVVLNHPDFGTYNGIRQLAWRSPRTIYQWNIDLETSELQTVTQMAYGDLDRHVNIPAKYLLLFNVDQEGANFEGISFLRACYGPYLRKDNYLRLNSAGIEKFAIPTPTVEVPDGKQGSQQYKNLIKVLQAFTSHQKAYLTYPVGWKLDLNNNAGFDPSKVEACIDAEDRRISKAFMANFLELGQHGTGSHALSTDLSDFFMAGLDHIADEICSKINQTVIPKIIQMNFGERKVYPKLKHSPIEKKTGLELAQVAQALVAAKVIIADDDLEDFFRDVYKWPPRSEDGQRSNGPAPSPQMSPGAQKLYEKVQSERAKLWQNKK